MKLTAIAPWFGGKRTLAPTIVQQLGKHSYYFEACAGSMAVLLAKKPSSHETVCDLHGALTNLAWCVQEEETAVQLFNRLQRMLYSEENYKASKDWLADNEQLCGGPDCADLPDIDWAYHYFIASWMGRNGFAGTARANYQLATRWTPNGGSGPLRFRNAVDSIPAWCERLRNVLILRRDLFEVMPKVDDLPSVAIYADPPYFPETRGGKCFANPGQISRNGYLHEFDGLVDFTEDSKDKRKPIRKITKHELLALMLRRFKKARVVVSYYASPLLEQLYPGWTVIDCSRHKHLHVQNKRGSGRKEAPEVLLVNGPVFSGNGELF